MEQSKPPVIALDVMSSISSELQTKGPLVAEPIQKSRSFALGDRQTEIVLNHYKDDISSSLSSLSQTNKATPMS